MILENISILSELNLFSICARIFLALILGGILGIERQQKQRPAGFRTYIIVCLGATLACITNIYMFQTFGAGDPARIPAQVISGIGFLGAGTILVTRNSHVKGLTTAAGLWCVATIGVSVGSGFYTGAIICTLVIVFSLSFLTYFDTKLSSNSKYLSLYIEYSNSSFIKCLLKYTKSNNISLHDLDITKAPENHNAIATFTIRISKNITQEEVYETLRKFDGLVYIDKI